MTTELETLRACSFRWGSAFDLIQGAGGNTSIKIGDVLHVKASGTRLADAEKSEIFVPISLAAARAMAKGVPAPVTSSLRPSIETSLHAAMPHRVVAHFHMVDAIALGVCTDAAEILGRRLAGLPWTLVSYAKPGVELAQAVEASLERSSADILVLANHGILIGADSCAGADAILTELRKRLATESRRGTPDLARLNFLAAQWGLELPRLSQAHDAATDPVNLQFALAGTLYPDHVVFLGRGAQSLSGSGDCVVPDCAVYLVPGAGMLLKPGLPQAAHEMAACLGMVASRIPADARIRTLTREDEDALVHWEAEAYRRQLAAKSDS